MASPGLRGNRCHSSSVRKGMNGLTSRKPVSKQVKLVRPIKEQTHIKLQKINQDTEHYNTLLS